MKTQQYRSLIEFTAKYDLAKLGENDLIISDIDGVFFKSILDPREIIGIISKKNLKAVEKLLNTKAAFWIFTNRWALFRHFPFIKQLKEMIKKTTTITPLVYSNCSQFQNDRLNNYVIIMNSNKPDKESIKVVEKGIANFEKVIYLGGQDTPFVNTDLEVVKELEKKKVNLDKLTFISISIFST